MATTFPTSLDAFSNPSATTQMDASPALFHDVQHANANDAIAALQAKVGIDSSANVTSLDYLVSGLRTTLAGLATTAIVGTLTLTKAGSTARTVGFADAAHTVAGLQIAQTFTAAQTISGGSIPSSQPTATVTIAGGRLIAGQAPASLLTTIGSNGVFVGTTDTNRTIFALGSASPSGSASIRSYQIGAATDGDWANPLATPAGADIGLLLHGYDGAAITGAKGAISIAAGSPWSAINNETYILFRGVPSGSTTLTEWGRIQNGTFNLTAAIASSSTTTGTLTIPNGGLGVGLGINAGGTISTAGSGTQILQASSSNAAGFSVLRLANTGASGRIYDFDCAGNTTAFPGAVLLFDSTASALRFSIGPTGGFYIGNTYADPGQGSLRVQNAITSVSPTAGIGYATGAGGTVTQATSRTTGVTINKVCGEITLFTAAGSTTATSFTVTNSAVAATDHPYVVVKSATNKYLTFVTAVAAGSFEITFYTTGGVASDAPVFGFDINKAVNA